MSDTMSDDNENELSERVTVRFTPRDLAAIYDAAAAAGAAPGAFIRRAAVLQAKQLQLFPEPKFTTRNRNR